MAVNPFITNAQADEKVQRAFSESVPKSPNDDKVYGQKNGQLIEVVLTPVGGGNVDSVNGQTPDGSKNVFLTTANVPDTISKRYVSDSEKLSWNNKQDSLSFAPENSNNKKTTLTNSDTDFPTTKAVKTELDVKVDKVIGKSLLSDTEITRLSTLTNQDVSSKQDVLISGTNIKTINGNPILGSGNITLQAETFRGSIDLSTATPTLAGIYQPTVSGTYSNFGGTIVDLTTGFTTISFDGVSVYGKQVNGISAGSTRIQTWTATTFASGTQVIKDGKVYESNASVVSTDVPGVSSKWTDNLTAYNYTGLSDSVNGIIRYDSITVTPSQTGKYIFENGSAFVGAAFNISGLITLKAGEKINVNIPAPKLNSQAIGVWNGTNFENTAQAGKEGVLVTDIAIKDYEFTATKDCQVAVTYTAVSGFKAYTTDKSHEQRITTLETKVAINETDITSLKFNAEGNFNVPVETAEVDKWIFSAYGEVVTAVGSSYSKPIPIRNGDRIKLIAIGTLINSAVIAKVVTKGLKYVTLFRSLGTENGIYEYTATEDCEIAVCFNTINGCVLTINRGTAIERLNIIGQEPIIVAPYHDFYADGTAGSQWDAENVTAEQLDAEAFKIQKDYNGYISREVLGKDSSGLSDIPMYVLTKRNFFAYKNKNKLHAWKDGSNSLVYIDSYCPVPADSVYSDANRTVLTTVTSYNSTTGVMIANSVSYIRSKVDNIKEDIIYLDTDLYEYKLSYESIPIQVNIFDKNEKIIEARKQATNPIVYNDATKTVTYNSKAYVRAPSYDYGRGKKHTIVLWGNLHAPSSDPMCPAITLINMMRDLGSSTADSNPLLKYLKYNCKVIIIPVVSPWAVTQWATVKREGRTNFNNVNINRNFDYKWETAGESKGASAGDQIEARYLMDTCSLFSANVALDIHCLGFGNYVNRVAYNAILPTTGNQYLVDEMKEYYNKYLSDVYVANADSPGVSSGFICNKIQISGGVVEMNAGVVGVNAYSIGIMNMNYDYLLKTIRLFMRRVDNTIVLK